MHKPENKVLIFIWSLKRSGSHGLVKWLFPHFEDYEFLNNMSAKRPINPARQETVYRPKDALMVSFEDADLCNLIDHNKVDQIIKRGDIEGRFERLINIVLIRDPFNLIASRMKGGWDTEEATAKAVRLWKIHARECLGDTNFLQNKLVVLFHDWFSDIEYRKSMSKEIGFPFTDDGKSTLGHWGSSFDGKAYRNNANEMKVLERWRYYKDQAWFQKVCSDPEILELWGRISDWMPEGAKEIVK